ncbi:molybdate ABC transporter substrate-binding protein [Hyalangium rubrum]|uniref:Molybdate ABC transporter substrate-binding protein n=1 Tax=Hyalangium rubrum TaxID=3103134 RepID=A0ABU5H2Z2_9BACT|nr:molybdate ABC transporter substrate-binding protein [Hyalangium sp. s54d21]MDY7227641.1 molybdate ABC transporter substrate-binding protein [Hyalangium sp. s54d21]
MRTPLLALLLTFAFPASAAERVLVFAAASTTDALQEIGRAYTQEHGATVEFAFGASSDLARQAVAGAPADAFLSADVAKMDQVEKAGLLQPGTRADLLSNQLVVVVPVDSKRKVASAADLRGVKRLALADPAAVPAGLYAKAWLERTGVWKELEPQVVPLLDVRAALTAVEAGRVDAGVVYATDAAMSKRVRVVFSVSEKEGPRIVYPVAALSKGKASEGGQTFVRFLQGDIARRIFERHGFTVLAGKPSP